MSPNWSPIQLESSMVVPSLKLTASNSLLNLILMVSLSAVLPSSHNSLTSLLLAISLRNDFPNILIEFVSNYYLIIFHFLSSFMLRIPPFYVVFP